MVLTQQQVEAIRNLYGEDNSGAERTLELINRKRGALKIFNEDGSVNISKEELEKKLNKPSKQPKQVVSSDEIASQVINLLNQTKSEIRKLKDLKEYNTIELTIKQVYGGLKKKREELKDLEIARIDKEIGDLQELKSKLLAEKNGEKN